MQLIEEPESVDNVTSKMSVLETSEATTDKTVYNGIADDPQRNSPNVIGTIKSEPNITEDIILPLLETGTIKSEPNITEDIIPPLLETGTIKSEPKVTEDIILPYLETGTIKSEPNDTEEIMLPLLETVDNISEIKTEEENTIGDTGKIKTEEESVEEQLVADPKTNALVDNYINKEVTISEFNVTTNSCNEINGNSNSKTVQNIMKNNSKEETNESIKEDDIHPRIDVDNTKCNSGVDNKQTGLENDPLTESVIKDVSNVLLEIESITDTLSLKHTENIMEKVLIEFDADNITKENKENDTTNIVPKDESSDTVTANEPNTLDVNSHNNIKAGHPVSCENDNENETMEVDNLSDGIEERPNDSTSCRMDTLTIKVTDENEVVIEEKPNDNTSCRMETSTIEVIDEKVEGKAEKGPHSGLLNTLDILSDDDETQNEKESVTKDKQCIDLLDDDDIMLIEEDDHLSKNIVEKLEDNFLLDKSIEKVKPEEDDKLKVTDQSLEENMTATTAETEKEPNVTDKTVEVDKINTNDKDTTEKLASSLDEIKVVDAGPLVAPNLIKSFKGKISQMSRKDLEEFCAQKIVEGIIDRSNLSEIKTTLKLVMQSADEWRKRKMMLTKQIRDLQVVLKGIQAEQKKRPDGDIVPLRITRSVGMQVIINESKDPRFSRHRKTAVSQVKNNKIIPSQSPKGPQKPSPQVTPIPVPRLVPATNNSPAKVVPVPPPQVQNSTITSNTGKLINPPNGIRNVTPILPKPAEKRPFSSIQSVTVDLTDDEPPAKQPATTPPTNQMRLVPSQQLMQPRPQKINNNPRQVFIPITGPQNQAFRAGQTIMIKTVPVPNIRPRLPNSNVRVAPTMPVRMPQQRFKQPIKHPAPLPDVSKQHQPPNWKALPPAPDLKISKVENGIVISWKIEGYQEDSYEEIASYQLYAYQETSSPPNTSSWKKIGDVKALPLPMACTLTQFMAGYKYYFAVRAVDIRSRIGSFSLPGSILLLKN